MVRRAAVVLALLALVSAGAVAEDAKAANDSSRAFTLGLVQKELRPGLGQADVAERIGSPNIVTRDPDGREAWVYDKVASEVEVSSGSVGLGGMGSGASGSFAGFLGLRAGKRSEKAKSSQKTLTVVVRFSAEGVVESYTWHNSRF
jgi:hypothetical protein